MNVADEFVRIPLSKKMKEDYAECARMLDEGVEKDCASCSLNGGNLGCIGEYEWCEEEVGI